MNDRTSRLFTKKIIVNMESLTEAIENYYCKKYGTSYTFRDLDLAEHIIKRITKKTTKRQGEY